MHAADAATTSRREPFSRSIGTACVYTAGAGAYFIAVELAGLNFLYSPLIFGGIMLAAACFRPRLLPSALFLAAWGVAVLLVHFGTIPSDRTAPAYMFAVGFAAVCMLALGRRFNAREALESAAAILTTAGLGLYLSYDIEAFGRGWLWSLALLLNAAGLVLFALWHQHRAATRGPLAANTLVTQSHQ